MDTSTGREIELKFDVDEQSKLPRLQDLPGVKGVERPVEHHLEAVYFDTDTFVLAAHHITLRRRAGGDDAGWHLKLPVTASERREIHAPLTGSSTTVPESLARLVRVHVRDRPLVAIALLRTRRIVHRLRGVDGEALADVCDDRVEADRLQPEPQHSSWREWEIELVDGPLALLDASQELMATAGIRPSGHASKLGRALGDRFPAEPTAAPVPTPSGAAASVLLAYVHEQLRVIAEHDPGVRQNDVDAVHKMRVATRRLRSALATYSPLLSDEADTERLRDELRWLAGLLGIARDEHVQEDRLLKLIATEPAELLLGPVVQRVSSQFDALTENAEHNLAAALDGIRYFRLLDDLDTLLSAPRFTNLAYRSARKVVPELLEQEWKRVRSAVRVAAQASEPHPHDLALHEVRKAAKRLRYAAETALPVQRKTAKRLVSDAQKVQIILGEHQDSVVARELLLERVTVAAFLNGENTFSYGRLHAREQQRAADAVARFHLAWKAFSRPE